MSKGESNNNSNRNGNEDGCYAYQLSSSPDISSRLGGRGCNEVVGVDPTCHTRFGRRWLTLQGSLRMQCLQASLQDKPGRDVSDEYEQLRL